MTDEHEHSRTVCPECHGEGYYFNDRDGNLAEVATKCEKCEGDGWVYSDKQSTKPLWLGHWRRMG